MEVSGQIYGPVALPLDNQLLVSPELETEWAREAVWTFRRKYKYNAPVGK
jgi:hypothetical protein